MTLFDIACQAWQAGISVVPPRQDGTKAPLGPRWEQWTRVRADRAQIYRWYADETLTGLGAVMGRVSGNAECLEFEDMPTCHAFSALAEAAGVGPLVDRIAAGYQERTPGGGIHLIYRCDTPVPGNTKLARRLKRPEEQTDPNDRIKTLIETRGEHGYVVTAPSNGSVHPTGRPYVLLSGGWPTIVTITAAERAMLVTLARALDELPDKEEPIERSAETAPASGRPGDDFIERTDWADILQPAGWVRVYSHDDISYWRRPGKDLGISASTNYRNSGLLYVFSSSTPFEAERGINKFAAYSVLNHDGDYAAAAKALATAGYGEPLPTYGVIELENGGKSGMSLNLPAGLPDILATSDVANAERLVKMFGSVLRYSDELGWMAWDGQRWRRSIGQAEQYVIAVARSIWDEIQTMDPATMKPAEVKKWLAHLHYSNSSSGIDACLKVARSHPQIRAEARDFDSDRWALNVANGILDLHTGYLRPHDPDMMMSKLAPVKFDQDAQCPRFLEFMNQIFAGDRVLIDYLQTVFGYALTGEVREHALFFLFGTGRNGKSTLINAFMDMLGDYAREAAIGMLEHQTFESHTTDIVDLIGARLVSANETEQGRRMAEARVKALTGGDKLKGRYMRQDNLEFWPTHKLFLRGNHKPNIKSQDRGIWARIKFIPFLVTFSESQIDTKLPDKLREEMPGMLNWALEGCLKWARGGLVTPRVVIDATAEYRSEMDVLEAFLADCCEIGREYKAMSKDLYGAYQVWAHDAGEKPASQRWFGLQLGDRGYTQVRNAVARWWKGLQVRDGVPTKRQSTAGLPGL